MSLNDDSTSFSSLRPFGSLRAVPHSNYPRHLIDYTIEESIRFNGFAQREENGVRPLSRHE